jgi:hypothetical protein
LAKYNKIIRGDFGLSKKQENSEKDLEKTYKSSGTPKYAGIIEI